ncbi:transmembrane protein 132A isoform X1 [Neophocaena asiaeorientalis asiaeorientalis]|uniref:Transmembrane protein 132A isoform X1 n=2 Tax=Neophocaena asiaeorientalis asiaeorientalis TaxID=1706337 RepID=A0A341BSM0_NEOAA|nr:transmembrane protein 132A isoform X1 [Neophocaena asiaeorientalis asiaeorientalis]
MNVWMAGRVAAAPRGPCGPCLCLLVALVLDVVRVDCDQDPLDPVYLPAALELLDAPEHFRVQQVGHYPPANSSLGSRSETFLLLQPWPRAQPLLRASYPPFATQQVVPPRVTEPHQRPVPWDVRAVSVEAAVTPAEPHARVLFHLKGQDWPPGPGSLPCARLHATHPAGTAHQACRFQPSLGACVVELEFPSHWFSQGSATRAELAYTLEPAAEGPGGCGPGREEDPGEQALPVGDVELRPVDPPQYQEVPLDEAVTLRVPDMPVRPGQLFSATLLLQHNFTASVLTLRIKVKKGLHVTAARPAQPALWTAKLDRFKGSKHHTTLITCHQDRPAGPDSSSPLELSEFLWVDFLVENGTSGGVAVTRPVTWQLEYPGQAPEAEKDKMVWEILVSERDIRALVPLAKAEELVNTAPLTGVPRHVPVRLVTVDSGGALVEVTEHIGCESANTQVLQVSEACDTVFVAGKESRGARGVRVDFWWRRLRASLRLTVWAPLLPLHIELTDTTLEQVRGWRVPGPAEGVLEPEAAGAEEAERRVRGCRLQYQRAGVRFLVPFAAHPLDGGRRLTHLLGPDWLLDVSHLVAPHARVQDPSVASLEGGRVLVGREPGVTSIEVRSPLSDSILGEQVLAVTDDKVSVLELGVQPVMGISLALSRGTAHPGEVTATCWAQSALPAPKQEVALSLWLSFSDHTLAPAELYNHRDLGLSVSAEEPGAVLPAYERGAQLGVVVSGAGVKGLPLHVALHPPEPCRRGRHRVPLASGTAWLGLSPAPTPAPALPSSPAQSSAAPEASVGGERRAAGSVGGGGDVRRKFEQAAEEAGKEKAEAREEAEDDEEMVPAPQRVTELELGMYALLGIFCLAILIFLVNGVVFMLRYQRKEPPDSAAAPAAPQPHNWVWLGTDQEDLSRQLDRQSSGLPKGEGGCPCESGGGGEALTLAQAPAGGTPSSSSTLARKEAGGRRKRVEFVTFAPAPPAQLPEESGGAPAVQSILVAGEEDIRWVCEDMGLKDPEELRSYMERIRGSS